MKKNIKPHFYKNHLVIAQSRKFLKKITVFCNNRYFDQQIFPDIFGDSSQYIINVINAKAFLGNRTYKLDNYFLKNLSQPLRMSSQLKKGKYITPKGELNQETIDIIFALKNYENE